MAKTANRIDLGSIKTITSAAPKKKPGNPEIMMEDIADLTAIDRIIAELTTAKAVIEQKVRAHATDLFLVDGCESKKRPENFKGYETETVNNIVLKHTASIELRANGSALSAEAQELATTHKIPTETKIAAFQTYVINPVYATDMEIMQKVVDALNVAVAKVGLPEDILQFQEGSSKVVTTDASLPAMFALPRDTAEILLPIFSTLAVGKFKYDAIPGTEGDLSAPLARTIKILDRGDFRMETKKARKA